MASYRERKSGTNLGATQCKDAGKGVGDLGARDEGGKTAEDGGGSGYRAVEVHLLADLLGGLGRCGADPSVLGVAPAHQQCVQQQARQDARAAPDRLLAGHGKPQETPTITVTPGVSRVGQWDDGVWMGELVRATRGIQVARGGEATSGPNLGTTQCKDAGKGVGNLGARDGEGEATEGSGGSCDRALEVQSVGTMACAACRDQATETDYEQDVGAMGDRHGWKGDCKLVAWSDTGADQAKGGEIVEDECLAQESCRVAVLNGNEAMPVKDHVSDSYAHGHFIIVSGLGTVVDQRS